MIATTVPRNEGNHSMQMNSVVIWVALQGFLEAWQLRMRLLWKTKRKNHVCNAVLAYGTTAPLHTHSTNLLHVKQHNQFYELDCRKKWCKQNPDPTRTNATHDQWFFLFNADIKAVFLLNNHHVRVCPYMSSNTLRAMSNTGFLFFCRIVWEKTLEGKN